MLLYEILGVPPLEFKWISNTQGVFYFQNKKFGILLDEHTIRIPVTGRNISVVNIEFGLLIYPEREIEPNNIDKSLTNIGNPRRILSTVSAALVTNNHLKTNDIIVLAAADQVKKKRMAIYSLAYSEINHSFREYKHYYQPRLRSGSEILILSKTEFTEAELEFLGSKDVLDKY